MVRGLFLIGLTAMPNVLELDENSAQRPNRHGNCIQLKAKLFEGTETIFVLLIGKSVC